MTDDQQQQYYLEEEFYIDDDERLWKTFNNEDKDMHLWEEYCEVIRNEEDKSSTSE